MTGKRRTTRFQMTEERAQDYPGAVKVEGSHCVRLCRETAAERALLAPKAFAMPTYSPSEDARQWSRAFTTSCK